MLFCSFTYGQINQYDYQRAILGVEDQWHKLVLPNDLFEKISPRFSDIRIVGITTANDTIEAPYILEQTIDKLTRNEVAFKIINTAFNEQGHYFTLDVQAAVNINQIDLNFRQTNFDWKLSLEGSHNQQNWFTIIDDYRVLSIQNDLTNYKFSEVNFPRAKYRYFRLLIKSKERVDLISATMSQNERSAGNYQVFSPEIIQITQNKPSKQTEIMVDLGASSAVSQFHINIQDDFDYYRPFTIQYIVDSFEMTNGWRYNYRNLTSGTLSSIEDNTFTCASTIFRKFKIIIHNHDNQPLDINTITAKGPMHELTIRFTQDADYFLVYGNKKARTPNYDISHFANNIPANLVEIQLDSEQKTEKPVPITKTPLFENKAWLWTIMTLIILLLGWFTMKMLGDQAKK